MRAYGEKTKREKGMAEKKKEGTSKAFVEITAKRRSR